jgi:hypothetical protein
MIFIVSEALEDLGAAQIRKRSANTVHIPAKKKVGNHIVHTDSRAFDPRVSTADSFGLHDVAITRCGFHEANYITTFRKIDSLISHEFRSIGVHRSVLSVLAAP